MLESGEYTCAPRPEEPEEPAEQPEAPPKEDALLRGTRAIRRASPRKSNARKTNALGGVAAAVLGGVAEKPDALSSRLSRARSPRATRATLTRKSKMAMASAGVLRITSTMADVHKATADFVRRHSRAPGGEHLASAFRPAAALSPPPPAVEEEVLDARARAARRVHGLAVRLERGAGRVAVVRLGRRLEHGLGLGELGAVGEHARVGPHVVGELRGAQRRAADELGLEALGEDVLHEPVDAALEEGLDVADGAVVALLRDGEARVGQQPAAQLSFSAV